MLSKTVLLVNVMLVVLNQTHQFQAGGANNAMQQRTVQINSSQNRKSVGKVQHVHHHYHSCTQRQNIQKSLAKISAKLDNLETKIICPDGKELKDQIVIQRMVCHASYVFSLSHGSLPLIGFYFQRPIIPFCDNNQIDFYVCVA